MSIARKKNTPSILPRLAPYLILLLAGIIAFFPVSFMLFSIKNDAVALDYPVKYFISQCLHNNVPPFWFNTWGMGFPIESIITWSIFSPLQFLWGGLFHYNLYTLHAEFIFYIALSGCSMFYFLKKHISPSKTLNLLLAMSYMLSGFTIGSSQWLIYISAQALLPLVLTCSFNLLKTPSIKTSLLFVAAFYTMLTSVYLAFTIILFYLLLTLTIYYIFKKQLNNKQFIYSTNIIKYLILTGLILVIICTPAIFYTFQVLQNIERGKPVSVNTVFFNSNYIPLKGFITLILPFTAPKIQAANTEGTMLDLYIGLLPLLLFPLCFFKNLKEKNWSSHIFLFTAVLFLVLSMGHLTPLRQFTNILPGFSYFRNPGLFRLFFILFILIYISATFPNFNAYYKLFRKPFSIVTNITVLTFLVTFILIAFFYYQPLNFSFQYFTLNSLKNFVGKTTYSNLLFISACIQFVILIIVFSFYSLRSFRFLPFIFGLDVIFNCLICTPFFTVSSYSVKQTNDEILKSTIGFPVQKMSPANIATSFHIDKAAWYNINVYQKEVSSLGSYFGPLMLENVPWSSFSKENTNALLVFSESPKTNVSITEQKPNYVSAFIETTNSSDSIVFQQNFYNGWKAYFNNQQVNINSANGLMKVQTWGNGRIEFKYDRSILFVITIIINVIIIGIALFYFLVYIIDQFKIFPPS